MLYDIPSSLKSTTKTDFVQKIDSPSIYKGRSPMLVMSYDDGDRGEYTNAFPVHRDKNAPAVFCENVKMTRQSADELKEMYNEGMEIASHGYSHVALGKHTGEDYGLLQNANSDDTVIYVKNGREFSHHAYSNIRYKGVISEGEKKEEFVVIDRGRRATNDENELTLENPLENSYTTSANIEHHIDSIVAELEYSQRHFAQIGIEVHGIAYAHGGYDERVKDLASRYYKWGRAVFHRGEPAIITPEMGFDMYAMGVGYWTSLSENDIEKLMDEAVERVGMLSLFCHTYDAGYSNSKLEWIIDTAKSKGIDIVTYQEALKRIGARNYRGILSKPDYIKERNWKYFDGGEDITFMGTSVLENKNIMRDNNGDFWKKTIDESGIITTEKLG